MDALEDQQHLSDLRGDGRGGGIQGSCGGRGGGEDVHTHHQCRRLHELTSNVRLQQNYVSEADEC